MEEGIGDLPGIHVKRLRTQSARTSAYMIHSWPRTRVLVMISQSYVEIEGLGPTVSGNRGGGGLLLSLAELPDFLFQQLCRNLLHGLCEEARAMGYICSLYLGSAMTLDLKSRNILGRKKASNLRGMTCLQLKLDEEQKLWIVRRVMGGASSLLMTASAHPQDDPVAALLQQSPDGLADSGTMNGDGDPSQAGRVSECQGHACLNSC